METGCFSSQLNFSKNSRPAPQVCPHHPALLTGVPERQATQRAAPVPVWVEGEPDHPGLHPYRDPTRIKNRLSAVMCSICRVLHGGSCNASSGGGVTWSSQWRWEFLPACRSNHCFCTGEVVVPVCPAQVSSFCLLCVPSQCKQMCPKATMQLSRNSRTLSGVVMQGLELTMRIIWLERFLFAQAVCLPLPHLESWDGGLGIGWF